MGRKTETGYWEKCDNAGPWYRCSCCWEPAMEDGEGYYMLTDTCPYCGADMKGTKPDE